MNGKGAGVIPRWKNMLVDYIKQRINEVVPSCNKISNTMLCWHVKERKGLFGSVVAVAFQIAFRAKMHANDFFLFFKNYF